MHNEPPVIRTQRLARRGLFDGMAIGLSGLCLIHCLALPVLMALLPTLSIAQHWPEDIHFIAAVLAAFACLAALFPRWRHLTRQQKVRIGISAGVGLLCLFGATMLGEGRLETMVTVVGSVFLIAAHIQNLRV